MRAVDGDGMPHDFHEALPIFVEHGKDGSLKFLVEAGYIHRLPDLILAMFVSDSPPRHTLDQPFEPPSIQHA